MTKEQTLKQQLIDYCRAEIDARVTGLSDALTAITTARDGETKSSAGDKFETGRAMMQMEEAKLNGQLAEVLTVRRTLDQLRADATPDRIAAGSLVATNRGNYFLGVGLGKVKLAGRIFFCTSLESPVGQYLLGKQSGDVFTFNELDFQVLGMV
jgi:hypothetical protein